MLRVDPERDAPRHGQQGGLALRAAVVEAKARQAAAVPLWAVGELQSLVLRQLPEDQLCCMCWTRVNTWTTLRVNTETPPPLPSPTLHPTHFQKQTLLTPEAEIQLIQAMFFFLFLVEFNLRNQEMFSADSEMLKPDKH